MTEKSEELFLDDMSSGKWKNKYTVSWCHSCDTAIIICPKCKNGSCSGGGCEECIIDYEDWKKVKTHISDYLTEDEVTAYRKGLILQNIIKDSIRQNQNKIDWNNLNELGKFSHNDLQMFNEFFIEQNKEV